MPTTHGPPARPKQSLANPELSEGTSSRRQQQPALPPAPGSPQVFLMPKTELCKVLTRICVPESLLPITTVYNFTVLQLHPPKGQHATFLCRPTLQVLSTSFQRVLLQHCANFTKSCHASTFAICLGITQVSPMQPYKLAKQAKRNFQVKTTHSSSRKSHNWQVPLSVSRQFPVLECWPEGNLPKRVTSVLGVQAL